MRFAGSRVYVGRWERPSTGRERLALDHLRACARVAEPLFRSLFPNDVDHWDGWNVCVLVGNPPVIALFQRWKGFGYEPFPAFEYQIRFDVSTSSMRLEKGRGADPTILHRAWDLLTEDGVPDDPRRITARAGWLSRYRNFGDQLARTGICEHPGSQTMSGLLRILDLKRLKYRLDRSGFPELVEAR